MYRVLMTEVSNILCNPPCRFIALTLICVDTMGGMYYWNVPLNPPSYMCIVISIGLSVDYCSHITYTFLVQPQGSLCL